MIDCILRALACVPVVAVSPAASQDEAPAGADETAPEIAVASHAELSRELDAIASSSELATLEVIGMSREGREIRALRLAGEERAGRPAILVVGNIEGPDLLSSAVVAYQARELSARAASDEDVRAMLSEVAFYFVPRIHPDAAEARFQEPRAERVASGRGVDNDRDRRDGEDGSSDVNGDGLVTQMRWLDPEGAWIPDPNDERAMVEADAARGERGLYKVSIEGRDSDGDGEIAEDPPHDTILNQNFPYGWREHATGAGRFPLDEPEARALADFVLEHPDVVLVVTYGELDNLVEKPKSVKRNAPSQKRIPPPGVIEPDAELLAHLGKRYAEIVENGAKGGTDAGGSFQSWAYRHRGLWSLAIKLWDMPREAEADDGAEVEDESPEGGDGDTETSEEDRAAEEEGDSSEPDAVEPPEPEKPDREPSEDAQRLEWLDSVDLDGRYLEWSSFEHPDLGQVEIGGWAPFAHFDPPPRVAGEIAAQQLEFLLDLPDALARVEVAELTARELARGLWEVEAALENNSLLPLSSASARRTRTQRPTRLRLVLPEQATLIAGERQSLLRELPGSGGRSEHRWLVQGAGPDEITLEIDSDHAGVLAQKPEVQR